MEAWYALFALVVAIAPLLLAWALLARRDRRGLAGAEGRSPPATRDT